MPAPREHVLAIALAVAAWIALVAGQPMAATPAQERADRDKEVVRLRDEVRQRPDDYLALYSLAAALHQLDFKHPDGGRRVPEAERLYRRAAHLAPQRQQKAIIFSNLGALLLSSGRLQRALEVMTTTLEEAEALGLQKSELYAGTLFNSAKVYQQLGWEEQEGATLAKLVVAAKGVSGSSYLKGWAAMRSHTPEQVAEMEACAKYMRLKTKGVKEEKLSTPKFVWWQQQKEEWGFLDNLSAHEQAWVYYALYRAYQKQGRYDKAWRALVRANGLQDPTSHYDRGQEESMTRSVISMFTPPKPDSTDARDVFYRRLLAGDGGYRDRTPVFVVGMPRSGSTLIEQILASHSQVWGAGEDTLMAPLVPNIIQLLRMGGEINTALIAAVGKRYVTEMRARLPAERSNATWFVDKMLRNAWNVGFIQLMLPDACIIHAVRHPADTGLSCFAQPFEGRGTPWASNLTDITHELEMVLTVMDHWDTVLPGKVLHVRYCDLVRDQEGTTRSMLEHCSIPWEDSVLRFHETKRQVSTASLAQVRQALYTTSMGKWKHYAEGLAPMLLPLRKRILDYEAAAGLESSEALLDRLVAGEEEEGEQAAVGRGGKDREEL